MIQIKHRSTEKVIKEVDATSLVNADLRCADLRSANLQYADLQYADLHGANLQRVNLEGAELLGADLRYANLQRANLQHADLRGVNIRWALGDEKRIKTIIDQYKIVIMLEYGIMAIGCEQHTIDEWMNFSDEEIDNMDLGALRWWKIWKPKIQQSIA